MGLYRYLLAVAVAASHFGFVLGGFNPGVVAVVSFMLLSGYVMTLLIKEHYSSLETVDLFYIDRACRLLPQFLVYSMAALILLHFTQLGTAHLPWMEYSSCNPSLIAVNFSLFGNNFLSSLGSCRLLPASWSLGLEAFFYALFPWLLLYFSRPKRLAAAALSVAVFLLGYAGLIDSNLYGYRYLVGTLHIFLAGAAIARPELFSRWLPLVVFVGAALLLAIARFTPDIYTRPLVKEVLVGLIIGIPMLALLKHFRFSTVDTLLGNLSYGVFLNHILCRWCAEFYFGVTVWTVPHFLASLTVSTALAAVTYFLIERPALRWRRGLRRSANEMTQSAPSLAPAT